MPTRKGTESYRRSGDWLSRRGRIGWRTGWWWWGENTPSLGVCMSEQVCACRTLILSGLTAPPTAAFTLLLNLDRHSTRSSNHTIFLLVAKMQPVLLWDTQISHIPPAQEHGLPKAKMQPALGWLGGCNRCLRETQQPRERSYLKCQSMHFREAVRTGFPSQLRSFSPSLPPLPCFRNRMRCSVIGTDASRAWWHLPYVVSRLYSIKEKRLESCHNYGPSCSRKLKKVQRIS